MSDLRPSYGVLMLHQVCIILTQVAMYKVTCKKCQEKNDIKLISVYLFIDHASAKQNFLQESRQTVREIEKAKEIGGLIELDKVRECVGYCFRWQAMSTLLHR